MKTQLQEALEKDETPFLKTVFGDIVIERHQLDVRYMEFFNGYDTMQNDLIFIPLSQIK